LEPLNLPATPVTPSLQLSVPQSQRYLTLANTEWSQVNLQFCMLIESVFLPICCQFCYYPSVVNFYSFCFAFCLTHFVQLFRIRLFTYLFSVFSVLILELCSRYFYPHINIIQQVNKHHTSDSTIFCLSIGSESLLPS
jgi:hypothetical protein